MKWARDSVGTEYAILMERRVVPMGDTIIRAAIIIIIIRALQRLTLNPHPCLQPTLRLPPQTRLLLLLHLMVKVRPCQGLAVSLPFPSSVRPVPFAPSSPQRLTQPPIPSAVYIFSGQLSFLSPPRPSAPPD